MCFMFVVGSRPCPASFSPVFLPPLKTDISKFQFDHTLWIRHCKFNPLFILIYSNRSDRSDTRYSQGYVAARELKMSLFVTI